VGEKTAYEAKKIGFKSVQSADKDALALAEVLRAEKGLYVHFRGQDISKSLIGLLADQEGLTIEEFTLYRAVKASQISTKTLKYMGNNEVSHALFYSKRTAKTFVELLQRHECTSFVKGIKALCLADSMVECLSVLPWQEIKVAAHPDQQSMLELLKEKE
jgi:uroporphyrinogen-III synthase